ncbi:hypothetical protein C0992_008687 [Termitomyces sp. T32_za158]|nr:hypothetical protein C0992_008687 [Termitomyces sp. T32_za158]
MNKTFQFDHSGVSGGCQAMYTMIKSSTPPDCPNVTAAPLLSVEGTVAGCTSTSSTVQYHISDDGPNHLDGITDADGKTWANGPMHSWGYGSDDCLAPGTIPRKTAQGIAAGASVGSLVAGLLIGSILMLVFRRRYPGRFSRTPEHNPSSPPPMYSNERPLPPTPVRFKSSGRLPKWLGLFRKRREWSDSNILRPFTLSWQRMPVGEPKATAQPLVPNANVQDDSRDRQSVYSETTGIDTEPPPSYIPSPRLKTITK